jgi:hypothetical protein
MICSTDFNVLALCILNSSKKGKDKAIPVQASIFPEGSSKLRLPHFKNISI